LEMIPNIKFEDDCRELCGDESGCEFYTFYLEDDPNYGACFLLSSLKPPIQDCPTCVTGPMHCDDTADCSFIYEGNNQTHLMFTQPRVSITFFTSGGSHFAECQLRVLAVGGGGHGNHRIYSGGGGSGYIQYYTQTIPASQTQISVIVGDHDKALTVNIDGGDTLVAAAGHHNPGDYLGGDGYSGGGGYNKCNGGSDGGGGESGEGESTGGSGTGEDITSYALQYYKLSPGAGGQHRGFYGGGGGGVLVDGAGPDGPIDNGQGYGGGGTHDTGNSGVVILEFIGKN